jgi:hypothetical protein
VRHENEAAAQAAPDALPAPARPAA